jgi:DUF1680 family protein
MLRDRPLRESSREGSASFVDPLAIVLPTASAISHRRPIDARGVRVTGGFWKRRVDTNHSRTIPHGFDQLEAAGNFHDLRLAAGAKGEYRSLGIMFSTPFPFLDSDVYKWLEGVGWELGREGDPNLREMGDQAIALVQAAQRPDGYINSFVQVLGGNREYRDLPWGHELYTMGHLFQAAVAWHRAIGDDRLLDASRRAADHIDRALGLASGREAVDGHPEVEMALVELYRVTGEQRYLDLARRFVDLRGHGMLGEGRFGASYWQDHVPVREAPSVAGHSVRQLYLDCGAVDVAVETGDRELLDAVIRRWRDMVATRSYITGGLGSRDRDEAFGDPYELPPDRAYNETCAAIASVMLSWRLLLATGEWAYADQIERTLYNAVLAGVSFDGTSFFYRNPLQRRTFTAPLGEHDGERRRWYLCACCPPNLMRTIATFPHLVATASEGAIQLQQYAAVQISTSVAGGPVKLAVETDYPWTGDVIVRVLESGDSPWSLRLRQPAWARRVSAALGVEGTEQGATIEALAEPRSWRPGDVVRLSMEMPIRVVEPDRRIDAVRDSVAIERGPFVYAIESADLPEPWHIEDVSIEEPVTAEVVVRDDVEPGLVGVRLRGVATSAPATSWPYRPDAGGAVGTAAAPASTDVTVEAIPYFAWANREPGAMRVWIPRAR